jgi:hypothetical protein
MFAVARLRWPVTMWANEVRDCFSGIGYGFEHKFIGGG